MDFRWRYQDSTGREVAGPDETFDDQSAAEDWLGQAWQDLLGDGVDRVTLLRGEAELYGPMSLNPSDS